MDGTPKLLVASITDEPPGHVHESLGRLLSSTRAASASVAPDVSQVRRGGFLATLAPLLPRGHQLLFLLVGSGAAS
jgi:hypothetical protein